MQRHARVSLQAPLIRLLLRIYQLNLCRLDCPPSYYMCQKCFSSQCATLWVVFIVCVVVSLTAAIIDSILTYNDGGSHETWRAEIGTHWGIVLFSLLVLCLRLWYRMVRYEVSTSRKILIIRWVVDIIATVASWTEVVCRFVVPDWQDLSQVVDRIVLACVIISAICITVMLLLFHCSEAKSKAAGQQIQDDDMQPYFTQDPEFADGQLEQRFKYSPGGPSSGRRNSFR